MRYIHRISGTNYEIGRLILDKFYWSPTYYLLIGQQLRLTQWSSCFVTVDGQNLRKKSVCFFLHYVKAREYPTEFLMA